MRHITGKQCYKQSWSLKEVKKNIDGHFITPKGVKKYCISGFFRGSQIS